MFGRKDKLRRERLTISQALECLGKNDEPAFKSINKLSILDWNFKDFKEYDRDLERNEKILEALKNRFMELTGIYLNLWEHRFNFHYFPELRIYYESKGNVDCLDWMSRLHVVIDVEVKMSQLYYFEKYFSPEDTGFESVFLFRTPIRLLKYLFGETTTPSDVRFSSTSSNTVSYGVRDFPDKIELSKNFAPWIKNFCDLTFSSFAFLMYAWNVLDRESYHAITLIKMPEAEPTVDYSELGDKDIERLRKINHVKDHHHYSWWGKNILGISGRQGSKDNLEKLEAGGYIRTYKGENGVRVELTEKGLRAIA